MEYFLELFGEKTIGWGVAMIAAFFFLYLCYRRVEKYFAEKAIREKEKDERIQKVIDQAEQYSKWHQQSLDIQKQLEKIEADNLRREQSKLRDRLLQSYRYYASTEKNPMQAWSEMEADAFWNILKEYEGTGGNGHIHTEVKPTMRKLEVIPMHESERIAILMNSRK